MTAMDLNLGVDFDELEAEEARANRPAFNNNPIRWRGTLTSIGAGSETFSDGREFPRHAFTFEKCKFLDVGNAIGQYHDGDSYVLLIQPIEPGKSKRFSQLGKTTKASGMNLDKFLGFEVEVTEIAETYKAANGFDRQSYHWKFAKVGNGSNGATPAAIPEEQIAAALAFIIAGGQYTEQNVGMALLKGVGPQSSAALNGKFSDGSFIKEMLAEGRLSKNEAGVLTT